MCSFTHPTRDSPPHWRTGVGLTNLGSRKQRDRERERKEENEEEE
jgi:hypothetical protein